MAPNPIITRRSKPLPAKARQQSTTGAVPLSLTVTIVLFAAANYWSRKWVLSGAGLESLLLVYGAFTNRRVFPDFQLSTLLTILNLAFASASITWFSRLAFATVCYGAILLTALVQSPSLSRLARKWMRWLFPGTHFYRDKLGFFHVPALAIDTEVVGLLALRGLTFSLSDLSIEVHGIELAVRLDAETELALCLDRLEIKLFRNISMGDVHGNLKVGQNKGFFADSIGAGERKDNAILTSTSQFLGRVILDQRKLDDEHIPPSNDRAAEKSYNEILKHIEASSPISTARTSLEQAAAYSQPTDAGEIRQTICAKLREVPSVSHLPTHAVRVSVLQTIFPRVRKFLHRLPVLIRLVLNPLSYFHPIDIASVNIAGPGKQLQHLLKRHMFDKQDSVDAEHQHLHEEVSSWLESADFCVEVADLAILTQVPFSASGYITVYLRSPDVGLYRTLLETDAPSATLVTHVGGADATAVIPAFLLPHHEHALPPSPSELQTNDNGSAITKGDETEVWLSVHASLPTYFDQSLLDIGAMLAKATGIIDLENLFDQGSSDTNTSEDQTSSATDGNSSNSSKHEMDANSTADSHGGNAGSHMARLAGRMRESVKGGIKKGLKKNAAGDKLNDRWIAKTVGKLATQLESAQGEFGYTTALPLSLQSYRLSAGEPSKILP